jgi:protein-S-isoprenylcysteine O-methyltransferase Ste14
MRHRRLMLLWAVVVHASWLVLPFVAAGRVDWVWGWSYFAVMLAGLLAHGRYVARNNPELRKHRRSIGEGTPRWDIVWNLLFWPLMAAIAITAGCDARHGGSSMSPWLWPCGLVLLWSGFGVSAWAMSVNPHFEGTVRIQTEREHRVIDAGPYRTVRHPGYLGLTLWALGSPLLLQSWTALIAAMVVAAWIALRITLEDGVLRRELDGYDDYARRVRSRLIPGLW